MLNWDFLDNNCEVWCINLKHRTDRFKNVCNEFKKINLLDKVNFYHPELDKSKLIGVGCWESHVYCMKQALKNNKNLLIFEDDVIFDNIDNNILNNIKNVYENEKWDIFRLGSVLDYYTKRINNYLWEGKFTATHALFINKEYIKKNE